MSKRKVPKNAGWILEGNLRDMRWKYRSASEYKARLEQAQKRLADFDAIGWEEWKTRRLVGYQKDSQYRLSCAEAQNWLIKTGSKLSTELKLQLRLGSNGWDFKSDPPCTEKWAWEDARYVLKQNVKSCQDLFDSARKSTADYNRSMARLRKVWPEMSSILKDME